VSRPPKAAADLAKASSGKSRLNLHLAPEVLAALAAEAARLGLPLATTIGVILRERYAAKPARKGAR
jgi:hypothetical protein